MHEGFPDVPILYGDPSSLRLLRYATLVEARGYGRWNRLREVAELSRLLSIRRVGIGHAPDTRPEATRVAERLVAFGLEPILPHPGAGGDPEAQAEAFRKGDADLNVVAGMGVAAEALFLKAAHVPTVVLIARDRRLRHNSAAALYLSRSYLQDALHGHWPPGERTPLEGGTEAALRSMVSDAAFPGEDPPPTRVEEAMSVAHNLGARHLGVTFCVGFREEAQLLERILQINGFRVSSACCKTGATPKEEIGLRDEEKVRPGRPEMICNPVAQAQLLNREGVEMAFVLGQCVGHDAATLGSLEAPAACLVAKDRVLGHNPAAALL